MIEILAVAAGAVLAAVGVHLAAPARPRASRRPPAPSPVAQLERAERAAQLISSAGDVHTLLRPALRQIAAERLWARGLALDGAARRLLGEELWELVRDARPAPDLYAAGLTPAQRDVLLDRLEAL